MEKTVTINVPYDRITHDCRAIVDGLARIDRAIDTIAAKRAIERGLNRNVRAIPGTIVMSAIFGPEDTTVNAAVDTLRSLNVKK